MEKDGKNNSKLDFESRISRVEVNGDKSRGEKIQSKISSQKSSKMVKLQKPENSNFQFNRSSNLEKSKMLISQQTIREERTKNNNNYKVSRHQSPISRNDDQNFYSKSSQKQQNQSSKSNTNKFAGQNFESKNISAFR